MDSQLPKILAVDDTEDNLDLLQFALSKKQVKFMRASSGKECILVAREKNPDVILLDIQMPEMDGFETLERLRIDPYTAKIPVVFLTATRKDAGSIEKGLAMGADGYLTKPIDIEELLVRVKMLVRIKRAEAELERTKADFMAMLVHDLRSPLNGIKSTIEFLKEMRDEKKHLSADHLQLLDPAGESANRMLNIVNDILDLSKFESGNIHLQKTVVPYPLIVTTLVREISVQYRQKGIAIETTFEENLPEVNIDINSMGQVLMNLLSNSLKFTKSSGSVKISVSRCTAESIGLQSAKQYIGTTVTDTGAGIPDQELPFIFDRYRQLSSAKVTKQKGTGLGLSICKLIVEAHGGVISVKSRLGEFTSFHFAFPVE